MKKTALYLVLIFSLAINIAVAGTLAFHFWRSKVRRGGAGLMCGQKPLGMFMRENLQLEGEEISRFQTLFSRNREDLLHLRDQVSHERQILFGALAFLRAGGRFRGGLDRTLRERGLIVRLGGG